MAKYSVEVEVSTKRKVTGIFAKSERKAKALAIEIFKRKTTNKTLRGTYDLNSDEEKVIKFLDVKKLDNKPEEV